MARPIKADLDIRDAQFGLFSTVFLLVYGICSPFAGYLADRVGRKPVIISSLGVWSVATLLTGYVTEYWQMITARVLLGVSEAFYMPAAVALIVDYHAGRTRSRATGLHLSGVYVGSVLGGLGGWFAEEHGWRFAFRLFGAIGVFYALVLVVVLRVRDVHEREEDGTSRTNGCDWHQLPPARQPGNPFRRAAFDARLRVAPHHERPQRRGLLASAELAAVLLQRRVWRQPDVVRSLRDDGLQRRPHSSGCSSAARSRITGRRGPQRARALVPAIGFCFAAPCLFMVGAASLVPVIIAGIVVVGMSQGFLDANLMPAVCTVSDPRHRATGYGLMNFVGTTAGGIMTYVGGWLKDANVPFAVTFQVASGFILVAGLLLFWVRPSNPVAPGA